MRAQASFRNQGGFHLICSGRDKIEKPEQLAAAAQARARGGRGSTAAAGWRLRRLVLLAMRAQLPLPPPAPALCARQHTRLPTLPPPAACQALTDRAVDGLIVIGGDDSNTNAAVLAEHLLALGGWGVGGLGGCLLLHVAFVRACSRAGGAVWRALACSPPLHPPPPPGHPARVIGVPKTIDGDLKNEDVALSFGFDTASVKRSAWAMWEGACWAVPGL